MADAVGDREQHAAAVGSRYLLKFEEDTLRERPLWIRVIIEFLGTTLLVTVNGPPVTSCIWMPRMSAQSPAPEAMSWSRRTTVDGPVSKPRVRLAL